MLYLCSRKREQLKTTTIMLTLIFILLFVLATLIFIQVNVELWNEVGDDIFHDVKKSVKKKTAKVKDWYKGTRLFLWNNNRKNGVKILSEKEYLRLLQEGKIKYVVIEEEG